MRHRLPGDVIWHYDIYYISWYYITSPGSQCLMGGNQGLLWIWTRLYGIGQGLGMFLEEKVKASYPMGLKSFVLGFLQPLFNILPNPLPPPLTFLFLYMYDYSTRTSSDWCTHIDHFHLNSSSASFFDWHLCFVFVLVEVLFGKYLFFLFLYPSLLIFTWICRPSFVAT